MKMKKWLAVTLAVLLLCFYSGCGSNMSTEAYLDSVMQMEQTEQDSPISGIRTGVWAQGTSLGDNEFECTDDGVYYMCHHIPYLSGYDDNGDPMYGSRSYLFYTDHNSDTMIKLCGRPDCAHDGPGCNAYFDAAVGGVSYYNGYLYVAEHTEGPELLTLYRLDPDGGNRMKVMDCSAVSEGYSGFSRVMVTNGIFTFALSYLDASSGQKIGEYFYFKLDGSMEKPEPLKNMGFPIGNDGVNFMTLAGSTVCRFDIEKDTRQELFDISQYGYAYYGAEVSYVLDGKTIKKLDHGKGTEETVFEIDLDENFTVRYFPDCIVAIEQLGDEQERNPKLYFYSWEGQCLGELSVDFPHKVFLDGIIGGETKNRIMLRTSIASIPEYYIEKSDFGTGHIELHKFKYPDLDEKTYRQLFGED